MFGYLSRVKKYTQPRHVPNMKVRAFYERWYRPENMAIVAVGDITDTGKR